MYNPERHFEEAIIVNNINNILQSWRTHLEFGLFHRYLMGRLPLNDFYLSRHVLSTAPPFILWWRKFEILFEPLPRSSPFIGGQR
jgi:hypothetical protein